MYIEHDYISMNKKGVKTKMVRRKNLYSNDDILAIGKMRSHGVSREDAELRLHLSKSVKKMLKK